MALFETTNVVIIEDDEAQLTLMKAYLRAPEYEVTAEAHTLDEAKETLTKIRNKEIQCDLMILDGRLDPSHQPCEDAKILMQIIEQDRAEDSHHLGYFVLGHSVDRMEENGVHVDFETKGKSIFSLKSVADGLHARIMADKLRKSVQ